MLHYVCFVMTVIKHILNLRGNSIVMCNIERDYLAEAVEALQKLKKNKELEDETKKLIEKVRGMLEHTIKSRPKPVDDDSDCPCGCE